MTPSQIPSEVSSRWSISPAGTEVMCGRCSPPLVKLPNSLIKKIQKLAPVREPQRGESPGESLSAAASSEAVVAGAENARGVIAPSPPITPESPVAAGLAGATIAKPIAEAAEALPESTSRSTANPGASAEARETRPILADNRESDDRSEVGTTPDDCLERLADGDGGERPELPEYYWTWRMFVEGFSAAETAAIRRLSAAEVGQHLELAARHGLVVNPNWRNSADRPNSSS